MLEVCIDSLESAINAVYNGADELEVCSSLHDGGLTPSPGLVKQVLYVIDRYTQSQGNCVKRPKVNVMIRCRAGSDFCYTDLETDTMLDDIEIYKHMGVDRFVFGSLTDTQQVDDIQCIKVLAQAYPLPVTFHRAFDLCQEPLLALDEIIQLGFKRVLTSGQKASAAHKEAIDLIKLLMEWCGDKIEIVPGSGINPSNVKTFIDMGCKMVHSSCKRILPLPRTENDLIMGVSDVSDASDVSVSDLTVAQNTMNLKKDLAMGVNDTGSVYVTDGGIVQTIKKIISS